MGESQTESKLEVGKKGEGGEDKWYEGTVGAFGSRLWLRPLLAPQLSIFGYKSSINTL